MPALSCRPRPLSEHNTPVLECGLKTHVMSDVGHGGLRREEGRWDHVGLPTFAGFLSWMRAGGGPISRIGAIDSAAIPAATTLESKIAAIVSFYRWHAANTGVPVVKKLLSGVPRHRSSKDLLAHLQRGPKPSLVIRARVPTRDRPPVLLPPQIELIIDACARLDQETATWLGNLRDRFLFALLSESGLRLGEALGLLIEDWVYGRGSTPYVNVIARNTDRLDARVEMLRSRRVYVSNDLERLYSDYVSDLASRALDEGLVVNGGWPLFVNITREPRFTPLRASTVYDKVNGLHRSGVGPRGWTPHWFRHTHATALLLAGVPDWVVSRRLGHGRVQTTHDLYAWVTEDEALRAAANWKTYVSGWEVESDEG
jgi:integrase